jgi:hypothetical protein
MADKNPLGKPLALTEKELTKAAFVTEEDKEEARKFWRETAPEEFIDLLDAEPTDEGE